MPNKLKGLVSKKKIRYQKDGFDLDLTYITPRIIAMGFPAQSIEGFYRNHIDDVVSFFHKKHSGHYRIYNLCNERQIEEHKFEEFSIIHRYPFNDHNPPMFDQMVACCNEIQFYLKQNEENVVAIQCKAGKGRTGVIVCACLLQQNSEWSATKALQFYGNSRTTNCKGVTIPSQIRYIYYFAHFWSNGLHYESILLKLNYLVLNELPNIAGNNYEIQFVIYVYDTVTKKLKVNYESQFYEAKKDGARTLKLFLENDCYIKDDLKFQFILKSKFGKKENLCHCWLNTYFIVNKPPIQSLSDGSEISSNRKFGRFISESHDSSKLLPSRAHGDGESPTEHQAYKLTLSKHEIDKANKDTNNRTFPFNFTITFTFQNVSTFLSNTSSNPPPIKPRLKKLHSKLTPDYGIGDNGDKHSNSPNNSDNPDDHSESSESSTKNSNSDLDDFSESGEK